MLSQDSFNTQNQTKQNKTNSPQHSSAAYDGRHPSEPPTKSSCSDEDMLAATVETKRMLRKGSSRSDLDQTCPGGFALRGFVWVHRQHLTRTTLGQYRTHSDRASVIRFPRPPFVLSAVLGCGVSSIGVENRLFFIYADILEHGCMLEPSRPALLYHLTPRSLSCCTAGRIPPLSRFYAARAPSLRLLLCPPRGPLYVPASVTVDQMAYSD